MTYNGYSILISSFLFFRIIYSIYSEKIINELFQAKNYSFLVVIPWLFIYGKILVNPEILYGYPKLKKRVAEIQNQESVNNKIWVFHAINISNIQDKKLSNNINKSVMSYVSEIENFVNKEHPFRKSKFSFSDFAKTINIPASHINYIFKYHCKITFVEYKNHYRIKDALKLINEGYLDNLTLEGLASKVGFSSYNSFYTAFKKQTNLAPKAYLTNLDYSNSQNVSVQY
ncbi:MAG: helix-turn-helix domain-containing protein [Algibacter sp.]|uniref:helix-turn-helix domain-containing protein n=1 Tax=Algibacter sp. TaxID=1872428 RepID=UPI0026028198|nr:helix-turn-helix domain-containing protein [Algibacter sp.]MDG1728974.1 helix-turn-helix domain-containing protein [Algibacter sp.]MDG2177212.1 helix-turn-helix domain-containing protein [Algibacter sp.]